MPLSSDASGSVRGVSHAALRSHVLFLVLCTCFALVTTGCSVTTNSGNCDAQGGGNAVSCGPPVNASSPTALAGSPPTDGSSSGGSSPAPVASSSAVVGGSGVVTYIEDLQATPDSEPYDTQGVAQANGVSYPHSQGAQFCFGSNERKWTYVLGRKYSSFQGIIGLSDNSVSTAKIQFAILADGRPVYSKDLQVGQSATLNVAVGKVLQLELDTTLLTYDGGCGAATGEWADIRAVGP
jgi:hypothetical protein